MSACGRHVGCLQASLRFHRYNRLLTLRSLEFHLSVLLDVKEYTVYEYSIRYNCLTYLPARACFNTIMDLELLLGLINEVENNENRRPNRQEEAPGQLNSSQQHTARILDGLAEILVSKAGEVVGVGVQESEKKIIVTISTNEERFPLHIYDHLTTVWALLKEISDGYNQDRVQSKRPSHITTSTHKLPEETQQKIHNLLLAIYRYSSERLIHIINKRFRESETRLEAFKRIVSSLDAQQRLTASLDETCKIIHLIDKLLRSDDTFTSEPVSENIPNLDACFNVLSHRVENILRFYREIKRTDSEGTFLHS